MNKAELIEEIKKVCKVRNDIKIKMVVTGEDWSLDAKYVFLSESGAYVTDTLYLVNIFKIKLLLQVILFLIMKMN